jgi:hypothetical protein
VLVAAAGVHVTVRALSLRQGRDLGGQRAMGMVRPCV